MPSLTGVIKKTVNAAEEAAAGVFNALSNGASNVERVAKRTIRFKGGKRRRHKRRGTRKHKRRHRR